MRRLISVTDSWVGSDPLGGLGEGRGAVGRSGAASSWRAQDSQVLPRARMAFNTSGPSCSVSPPKRLVNRLIQREGTVCASSDRTDRVNQTSGAAAAC